jgi:hypothetical protein
MRPPKCWALFLLVTVRLDAQSPMPVGIVRGELASRTANEVTVRSANGAIASCSYDALTYFEPPRLFPGDRVPRAAICCSAASCCAATQLRSL